MKKVDRRAPEEYRFAVLAVDVALFTIRNNELFVRTTRTNRPPEYIDTPSLPGGIIKASETAEDAVCRLVLERGGINPDELYMEQLFTFSALERDPRNRVVSVAYLALIPWERASEVQDGPGYWIEAARAKKLAYDHDAILSMAIQRLQSRVTYTTLISKLLPKEFTLTELEHAFRSVTKQEVDKRNFRKKILNLGVLVELPKKRIGGKHRPAQLYRFGTKKVIEIEAF